jgi:inhibitor of cysteine peptidase
MMAQPPPAHTVTEADNGARLRLLPGESLVVVLPERPTTGYRWRIATTPSGCRVSTDAFEAPAANTPGAPGHHTWRLETADGCSGVFELRLQAAPGRDGGEPARSFAVNLAP